MKPVKSVAADPGRIRQQKYLREVLLTLQLPYLY